TPHLAHRAAGLLLGFMGQPFEDDGRDGRGGVLDAEESPAVLPVAHFPLDERDDLLRVLAGRRFGRRADDNVALVLEEDHRGRGVGALAIAGDRGPARLVDVAHDRIGGPEVNAEDPLLRLAHNSFLSPVADAGPSSRGAHSPGLLRWAEGPGRPRSPARAGTKTPTSAGAIGVFVSISR